MAHLTNFSFEFFYEIFTEDASLRLLYHGAKSQKWPKAQIKGGGGGPALIFASGLSYDLSKFSDIYTPFFDFEKA